MHLLAATSASSQAPGSVEVGLYGQVTRVEASQAKFESRTPLSLGIRGGVNLHRRIAVELEASTTTVDAPSEPLTRRYNQLIARATLSKPVSEFSAIVLGAGVARTDYEVTYNFGPSALLGIRTLIRDRYALRSDAIFNYLPASGAHEFALRTGVQVVFGPVDGPTSRDLTRGNLTAQAAGSIELGLYGQQWRLDPIWNLQNSAALGTRVGAFITSRSQFEVEATYRRLPVRDPGRPGQTGGILRAGETFRVTTFAFRYNHQRPLGNRLAVVAGLGPVRSSVEYVDHWGLSAASGARFAITRDLQLRTDAVLNYLPVARAADLGFRIGASTLLRLGR
jgi:hypothetical protein